MNERPEVIPNSSFEPGFREHTESPRKDLWWLSLQKRCLALQPGWAQEYSTQLLSHQGHQAHGPSPSHHGFHLSHPGPHVSPRCKKAQPMIGAGTWLSRQSNAFVLAVLEARLILSQRGCWTTLRQNPAVGHQNTLVSPQLSPFSYLKKSMQWGR